MGYEFAIKRYRTEEKMKKHSFVICAYNESPYLENCILSIKNQEYKDESDILMCTSTPNDYVKGLAEKYDIPLIINPEKGDIQSDWNFAYNYCDSQYITLVHQDDVYNSKYAMRLFEAIKKFDDITIFYSRYRALVTREDAEEVQNDINCKLRNLLSFPMRFPVLQNKKGWKKAVLRFGNSICCSSVTYNKTLLGERDVFKSQLRYSLDWDTYYDFAKQKGRFYFDREILTFFRIHQSSTSMLCIENELREKEDYIMFCKMWPKFMAKMIMIFYKFAYQNYKKLKV